MTARRGRRRLEKFRLDEISFVDDPAQRGANAVITKADVTDTVVIKNLNDEGQVCTEYLTVPDLLKHLHDSVPNREKAAVATLIAKQEAGEDPAKMAREMLERATAQLDRMTEAFAAASGASPGEAEDAVIGSRVGRRLAALIGAAERMLSDGDDAEDNEARRRADMAAMQAAKSAPVDVAKSALEARTEAEDELDRLAKDRAATAGCDFYTAYEAVCSTPQGVALIRKREGFHAMATGTAEHGRTVDPIERDFDEDAAMRKTDIYKSVQAGADARSADDALVRRAREIQVERCDPRLSLVDALGIAKAELPALAKAARI